MLSYVARYYYSRHAQSCCNYRFPFNMCLIRDECYKIWPVKSQRQLKICNPPFVVFFSFCKSLCPACIHRRVQTRLSRSNSSVFFLLTEYVYWNDPIHIGILNKRLIYPKWQNNIFRLSTYIAHALIHADSWRKKKLLAFVWNIHRVI